MQLTLTTSALLMGLAGGPHCVAMCGAACGAMVKAEKPSSVASYHLGRLIGYAVLGAIATYAIQSLAWLSNATTVLKSLWTFFHIVIFAWGMILVIFGRQPVWIDRAGQGLWHQVKKAGKLKFGYFYVGLLWALMPCGLLYSAVVMAAFNGEPIGGAVTMAAFAAGSGLSLFFAPLAWLKLKSTILEPYGMRLAGLLLAAASGWAIWMDVMHQNQIWCAT